MQRSAQVGRPDLRQLATRDLVTELARKAQELAKAEVALIAGVCAIWTVSLLLVAAVFGIVEAGWLPGWAAALVVAAVVLAVGTIAGLVGWSKRVRTPLEKTRRSIDDNVKWARGGSSRCAARSATSWASSTGGATRRST
jgi:hypothetical protein